jgi:conjugative transfer pilus assembly protein TraH
MLKQGFIVGLVLLNSSVWAGVDAELTHFFDNLGFSSNVTGSHAYNTQAAGYAAMGSVYARNQTRTLQLAHVDEPGFRSGCGGIDLFAGGFSFITEAQVVKFMQSILTNGGGYALNLALETELPEIAHSMQFMHKLANEINATNFSSCQAGEAMTAAVWPKNRAAHQQLCQDIGSHTNVFSDWAKARQGCTTGGDIEKELDKAKNNPEYKDRVLVSTNVVWEALQKNEFLAKDAQLAEVYMSISGTLVFNNKGAIHTYPSLATQPDFIKALLYGGKLPSYLCTDKSKPSPCLTISESGHHEVSPQSALVFQVETLLQGIYDHIKTGEELTSAQKGLIEMTQPAVFQLISANAQQNIGIQGSYELSQAVATDLLAQFLQNSLDVIRNTLSGRDLGEHNEERLYKNLQMAQHHVSAMNSDSRARFNAALKTNQLIRSNIKQALHSLTPILREAYQGEVS